MVIAVGLAAAVANACGEQREFIPAKPKGEAGADGSAVGGSAGASHDTGDGGAPDGNGGAPDEPQLVGGSPSGPSGGGAAGASPSPAGGEPSTSGGSGGGSSNEGGGGGGGGGAPLILKAFDDFVVSAEGWTITGDPSVTAVTYTVNGGHPDGTISSSDTGTGTWFFTAPSKYLGDASALAGGVLRFDLKVTPTDNPYEQTDVQLTSGALTLVYDCSPEPGTTWKTFTVPLSAPGWRVGTRSGRAAEEEDLRTVLSNLTRLRIRGEFNDGDDTGWLDNVYFASR
jgi:hypothetical protein